MIYFFLTGLKKNSSSLCKNNCGTTRFTCYYCNQSNPGPSILQDQLVQLEPVLVQVKTTWWCPTTGSGSGSVFLNTEDFLSFLLFLSCRMLNRSSTVSSFSLPLLSVWRSRDKEKFWNATKPRGTESRFQRVPCRKCSLDSFTANLEKHLEDAQ